MPKPKDIKQLQSFLGMINYLYWYSPRLAEITSPLRDLTKDNIPSSGDQSTPMHFMLQNKK